MGSQYGCCDIRDGQDQLQGANGYRMMGMGCGHEDRHTDFP